VSWTIEFSEIAVKQLQKLDKKIRLKIFDYLENRVCTSEDPKQLGKALAYKKAGLWRYRVGDYRIICQIKSETVTVFVLSVGHRKEVYR
jgi:mRNA interferase RelE/StbE